METNGPDTPAFARLLKEGDTAYRAAIAAQVEGADPTPFWERWTAVTAALLLASWASGAADTVNRAGLPRNALQTIPVASFARELPSVLVRFEPGPAREVVGRFIRLLPLTRDRWEALIDHAFAAAGEMRDDESANALAQILERSPALAAAVRGTIPPEALKTPKNLSDEVKRRRSRDVQAAVQGSFFVTGMTQEQVEETQRLLAKVIRQEVTKSVAGKRLETLGVGDFVEQATLDTGTDLTSARLETVYRTNINRAQTQGRLDICRDSTVRKFVPLMLFSATKDRRTRETHRAMDGFVATVEQIDAMGIPAPLGFNCRCAWSPMSLATAVRRGFCDEDGTVDYEAIRRHNGARQRLVDTGQVPDPGFIAG